MPDLYLYVIILDDNIIYRYNNYIVENFYFDRKIYYYSQTPLNKFLELPLINLIPVYYCINPNIIYV